MRIPLGNVWRAFPELDRFSDTTCERLVREAFRARPWSRVGMAALVVGGFVGACLLIFVSLLSLAWIRALRGPPPIDESWLLMAACLLGPTCAGWTALLVRDACLKRLVAALLSSTRCNACGYSLLGLRAVSGGVVCPECGESIVLADRGLTEQLLHPDLQRP